MCVLIFLFAILSFHLIWNRVGEGVLWRFYFHWICSRAIVLLLFVVNKMHFSLFDLSFYIFFMLFPPLLAESRCFSSNFRLSHKFEIIFLAQMLLIHLVLFLLACTLSLSRSLFFLFRSLFLFYILFHSHSLARFLSLASSSGTKFTALKLWCCNLMGYCVCVVIF